MTNYEKLFGTTTKAAAFVTRFMRCVECPAGQECNTRAKFNCKAAFAEYLRKEARDEHHE